MPHVFDIKQRYLHHRIVGSESSTYIINSGYVMAREGIVGVDQYEAKEDGPADVTLCFVFEGSQYSRTLVGCKPYTERGLITLARRYAREVVATSA